MKGGVGLHESVGHVRSVECDGGSPLAVEQDQSAGCVGAVRKFSDARIGDKLRMIVLGL